MCVHEQYMCKLPFGEIYIYTYVCMYIFLMARIYGDFDEFGNLRQLRECTLTDKDQASWRAQTQGIVWRCGAALHVTRMLPLRLVIEID